MSDPASPQDARLALEWGECARRDETPWLVKGVKEWLWVFTNLKFCLFRARDTRGREEIKAQIGEQYSGVIISDDFNVYNGYDVNSQQKCLADLRRRK